MSKSKKKKKKNVTAEVTEVISEGCKTEEACEEETCEEEACKEEICKEEARDTVGEEICENRDGLQDDGNLARKLVEAVVAVVVIFLVISSIVGIRKLSAIDVKLSANSEALKGFTIITSEAYYDYEDTKVDYFPYFAEDDAIDIDVLFPEADGWIKRVSDDINTGTSRISVNRYSRPDGGSENISIVVGSSDKYNASVEFWALWNEERGDSDKRMSYEKTLYPTEGAEEKYIPMRYNGYYFFVSESQYKLLIKAATFFSS